MEFRTLELKVMSAKDLKKVTFFSRMNVYVVVSLSGGDEKSKQIARTHVDRDGQTNPAWNYPVKFTVDEVAARQNRLALVFKLRCERALGDKDVGEVVVPVKELLDSPAGGTGAKKFVSYQVRKPSGKPRGQLTFSYQFFSDEKISGAPTSSTAAAQTAYKPDEPVMAYPAVGSSSAYPAGPTDGKAGAGVYPPAGYGYPPPPQPYGGYPHPSGSGYGYPPQPGYGYPPVQQPARKNKFGLGLGAGLLGGALGGMLIGDAISDAGAYDAGYDDGFMDGGFDF